MAKRFQDPMDAYLYDVLFQAKVDADAERDRYKAALERIASEDWRGNKPQCIDIAEKALRG